MLTNALILRIDRRDGHDAAGQLKWQTGSTIAVATFLDAVSTRQRYAMGATIEDADQTCFAMSSQLNAAGEADIEPGDRLLIQPENADAITADVVTVRTHRVPGGSGNTHTEIFLRSLPLRPGGGA